MNLRICIQGTSPLHTKKITDVIISTHLTGAKFLATFTRALNADQIGVCFSKGRRREFVRERRGLENPNSSVAWSHVLDRDRSKCAFEIAIT